MAFDGVTIRALVRQLDKELKGAYIRKIAQPEASELLLTLKGSTGTKRLFMSASATLPLIYLTEENKPAPMTAPNFCMLLRKHIGSGRITDITQPGNERVIRIDVEHRNELGDPAAKRLYIEIMGKHSNIVFTDENDLILDGIKHISFTTSSVREILPGRTYFIPSQEGKTNPYETSREEFISSITGAHMKLAGAISKSYTGISKTTAQEAAFRAGLDGDASTDSLAEEDIPHLWDSFFELIHEVDNDAASSCIIYDDKNNPVEFAPYRLTMYGDMTVAEIPSISQTLSTYYSNKNRAQNIHQKSTDLRKLVSTLLERAEKKLALQQRQMADTAKMDTLKTYGTLLQVYPHEAAPGAKEVTLTDFETNEPVKIPLDPDKNSIDNATAYFERYARLKRTKEALNVQLANTSSSVEHLASIQNALSIAENEADLAEIRRELYESGYIRKRQNKKGSRQEKSRPLHYLTGDGFHIYVGKNNFQNDELTFKLATGNDWWFHAKKIPGSHVIVRTEGRQLPDEVFETCARIAGYYSSGRMSDKLEIDYIQKKEVKKPSGAVPGYVIYYTNYSMTVPPTLPEDLQLID